MYFDAVVVFVTSQTLLFRLALAILWQNHAFLNQTWIPSMSMLNALSRQNTNIIGLVRIFQTEISREPIYIMKIFENVKRVYFFAAIDFSIVQKFHNMFKFFFTAWAYNFQCSATVFFKGGLISERFSIWLLSQKKGAKSLS